MSGPSVLGKLFQREARARVTIVYPWELPSIMRKHIATGAMGTVYFVLLAGIYLVAFGNAIGLQHWQWGLLSAASSFSLVLQLLSVYLVRRTGFRRSIWFAAALGARVLRGLALVLAFLAFDSSGTLARVLFIALLVTSNCFDALAAPPWLSWLADIIPEEEHGRFMGRRSAWIAFANALVVFPIGLLVDRADEGSKTTALMAVFALGLATGIVDLFVHRTIPEPRMRREKVGSFLQVLATPLRDRDFRPWLVFNACWTFAMTLGGSLATVYFVENLGIKRNLLGGSVVLVLLPLLAVMVTAKRAGELVDRHGVKRVLQWGHLLWASLPFFWLLATPETAMVWLAVAAVLGSVGGGAALNATGKLITRLRSTSHVPLYFAVSTCVGCTAGALGPLVAGLVLYLTAESTWTVMGRSVGGFHILFLSSLTLRLAATLLIRRLPGTAP